MSIARTDGIGPIWLAAVVIALVAFFFASQRRWAGAVAVVLILAVSPITDPGFYWQGWNTADTVPGTGIIPATAIVIAGVVFMVWPRHRPIQPPRPERRSPPAHELGRAKALLEPRKTQPDIE